MSGLLGNVSAHSWKVWYRDLAVYLHTWKTNFVPPFLEPVFYLVAFGVGFGAFVGAGELLYHGSTTTYVAFLAPGLLAVAIMNSSFFECTFGSFVRMHYQRTFDAIVATPLVIEDVIAGEMLWGATKSLIGGSFVVVAAVVPGLLNPAWMITPLSWTLLILPFVAVLGGLLFAAFAMCWTGIVPSIDAFNYPMFLLVTPMFLISGVFFPISSPPLPSWLIPVAWALPLTHVSTAARELAYGYLSAELGWSLLYLGAATAALFVLALWLMRRRLIK